MYSNTYSLPLAHIAFPLSENYWDSSETHYPLPSCLFQAYISTLTFKLLTLEGKFFRGLSLILWYPKPPENTGAGRGEKVGGGTDPEGGKGAERKKGVLKQPSVGAVFCQRPALSLGFTFACMGGTGSTRGVTVHGRAS